MTTHSEIAGLFDIWNATLQSGDPAKVAALYAEDAILLPTVSNQMRRTPAEIEDYFISFLEKSPNGRIDVQNIRIFDDVAINSGTYTFELKVNDDTSTVPCRYTFVYRRDNGAWKIIEHHSSIMPQY